MMRVFVAVDSVDTELITGLNTRKSELVLGSVDLGIIRCLHILITRHVINITRSDLDSWATLN